jgi:RHS repeat-associated protein
VNVLCGQWREEGYPRRPQPAAGRRRAAFKPRAPSGRASVASGCGRTGITRLRQRRHDRPGRCALREKRELCSLRRSDNVILPGQYYDVEMGLSYNAWRDYDPASGRYVESDPIGLAGASYSTYSYASGNPNSFVDPYGLEAVPSLPSPSPPPRPPAPVIQFPPPPSPAPEPPPEIPPGVGLGIVGQCVTGVVLALTPSPISACQDRFPPAGSNCPNDDERCKKAVDQARRIYNELTTRSIPQYMYNSRIGQGDAGHYEAIQQGQAALRNALSAIRRYCKVLPTDIDKMDRLANQSFPVRH